MKKITCIVAAIICSYFTYAQKKHYISFEQGLSFTPMGSQLKDHMIANQFNATTTFDWGWLFGSGSDLTSSSQYPSQEKKITNYRIRYSYQRNKKTAIEAGFGHIYRTTVTGVNSNGHSTNQLDITINTSNIYAAYLVKNKKENLAIGIGPALSICRITQQSTYSEKALSAKTELLPGSNITAYWHFVNQKNWFMGFRTDMSITTPVKIEPVTMSNYEGFVSGTSPGKVSSVMNTISFTTGIKL